jgi:hypothetical protein
VWDAAEAERTEKWRKRLTDECGADPVLWFPLVDDEDNVMVDDDDNELGYFL